MGVVLNSAVDSATVQIFFETIDRPIIYSVIGIIATVGQTEESIVETIEAGANAITYTRPITQAIFN